MNRYQKSPLKKCNKCMKPKTGFMAIFTVLALLMLNRESTAQSNRNADGTMHVGVAYVDITPEGPIRLTGYAGRKTESEGVIHRLGAKALAFGTDEQGPSIFITVDLVGIPGYITARLVERLSTKIDIDPAHVAISSSHTHGGPELGPLMNVLQYRGDKFSDSLLASDELIRISEYVHQLEDKLEHVALSALNDRRPALVSWGQGQAGFAKNRRTEGGPVDPALPLLRVLDANGKLRAVLINYACHGTTLGADVNKIHGDWMSEAQQLIEGKHPGAIAMVAIGCGADANPEPRGKMEHVQLHGKEIAENVEKLLSTDLQPLTAPPVAAMQWVKLRFARVPSVPELIKLTKDPSTVQGYYARLALERIARGQALPADFDYPIQAWTFGNDLAMINLAGEVVVDYSVRLKNELGAESLWINAYTNHVPCYIASRRVIREGGYEAEGSMYWYDKPSPLAEDVEDIIVKTVHDLLPASFRSERDTINRPELIRVDAQDTVRLAASLARTHGPNIQYMREWKAFGWFTEQDRVEWDLELKEKGTFNVYLEWSVSDEEAGKSFVLASGKQRVNGTIGKTSSWFTYRKEKIGEIRLPAGKHKLVFKPASGSAKGALLDLREVTLVRKR